MKKIIVALMLLTLSAYADVVPKYGYTSIEVERVDGMIGYRFCVPAKGCETIGEKEYYTIEDLEILASKKKAWAIASYIAIPFVAVGAAYGLGMAEARLFAHMIPTPGLVIGFFGGGTGTFFLGRSQAKLAKALMIDEEKSHIIVKDDTAMIKYAETIERLLKKI